jgi:hypothetical protein
LLKSNILNDLLSNGTCPSDVQKVSAVIAGTDAALLPTTHQASGIVRTGTIGAIPAAKDGLFVFTVFSTVRIII